MTTMISNLPRDLIEKILSSVPLQSMKAVRLTCKTWNILSKTESLAKMHIGKAREEETMMMIALMNNLYLMSVVVDVDPSIEPKGKLSFLYDKVGITQVMHYEGLLLCILKDIPRVLVWNPYWGQTRWIKLRYSYYSPRGYDGFNYTLGYEDKESCRNVKLLRFETFFKQEPHLFWYEIYHFDTGLWTTLDDVTPYWSISCSSYSVSLKGNAYWIAKDKYSEPGFVDRIICFDFTRERFGPLLPLPSSVMDLEYGYAYVTLSCFREENLAALFQHHESYLPELEIWITTEIGFETVSWSKFLRMDNGPKIGIQMSYCIDEEKKVFMGFEKDHMDFADTKTFVNIIGEAGYLKKIDLGVPEGCKSRWSYEHVCSYVPSLVQIKKHARGKKRIKQSRLEKCRFDQIKSRFDAIVMPRNAGGGRHVKKKTRYD